MDQSNIMSRPQPSPACGWLRLRFVSPLLCRGQLLPATVACETRCPGHRLPANVACGLGHCCDEFMAAAGSFREASPRPSFIHDVKSPSPVGFELRPGVVLSSGGLLLRCTVTGSPRRQAVAVTTIPSLSQFSTTGSMVQAVSSPPCPTPPSWSCSSSESSSPSSTRSGDKNNHSLQWWIPILVCFLFSFSICLFFFRTCIHFVIEGATKYLLPKLKDFQFFVGESMHDDSTVVFAYYKEGATNPTFLYFGHGLKEVKC
ncbi:hypothetical protein F2Q68_00045780 [Brassica cretica]|uniref:TCTP domain-containing protein n=1 Tax=Brassica cretica TaxID=69181 RepID=A0A8S9LQJ7_BRACR|nr:hypothetical protein F2Q68_00045780 [Brassica cretica]